MNARAMARCGGARVIYEETVLAPNGEIVEQVDGRVLADTILTLLLDESEAGGDGATQPGVPAERRARGDREDDTTGARGRSGWWL